MMSISRAWFLCGSEGREDLLEGLIVQFSSPIITPESRDLVCHCVLSGLISLVGGGAGHCIVI